MMIRVHVAIRSTRLFGINQIDREQWQAEIAHLRTAWGHAPDAQQTTLVSRGAALALHFSNVLAKARFRTKDGREVRPTVRFLGLWDVVAGPVLRVLRADPRVSVCVTEPGELVSALEGAVARGDGSVIVAGGDGTLATAAAAYAWRTRPSVYFSSLAWTHSRASPMSRASSRYDLAGTMTSMRWSTIAAARRTRPARIRPRSTTCRCWSRSAPATNATARTGSRAG